MRMAHHRKRIVCNAVQAVLFGWLAFLPLPGMAALEQMDEAAMSNVSGAGLAFVWEDFRWLTKPTSYFEQVGSGVAPDTTFKRGDLRWYGVSISGVGPGTTWTSSSGTMNPCAGQGSGGLGCPIGGTISRFSAHDNPYVLRVMDYAGDDTAEDAIGNGIVTWGGDTDSATSSKTVLEFLAPTSQPDYRFSFWGEIEAGKNPATLDNEGLLKTQTIIQGNASDSVLRLFQFTEPGNNTLALLYHSHLQGDFRFSANQILGQESDVLGEPVAFDPRSGLHFRNVDAYLPLGHLFYQALTIDVPRDGLGNPVQNGNFILEVDAIPDELAVYRRHYSLAVPDAPDAGYVTARAALLANTPGATPAVTVPGNYFKTHGYSRWGDWYPCQGVGCANPPTSMPASRNQYNTTNDGIFFRKCTGCANFDAFAYRMTAVDVRPGNNEFTCPGNWSGCSSDSTRYQTTAQNCTPGGSGDARFQCGYGGGYSFPGGRAATVNGKVNPMHYLTTLSGNTPTTSPVNVINTGVANLGDARIEGMVINEFRFTSFSAQY